VPHIIDTNIQQTRELFSPRELLEEIPRSAEQEEFVAKSRKEMHDIIFGDDKRLLLIVGPCSIHDVEAGREYAQRLSTLAKKVSDRLLLVMRVYFEKPRTTTGWKGLIMDPHLDGTYDIHSGLKLARTFLREVIDLQLPTATELLDPITPQYIADLVCWSAIGARTTESQTHRQMASGLSMPLGFKNTTDGSIQTAINAIKAASKEQTFLGINGNGKASAVTTRGNPNCHVVLRGGSGGSNYSAEQILSCEKLLEESGLIPAIMVDCSHGNSDKDHRRQPIVLKEIVQQSVERQGNFIIGAMLESNLVEGKQKFPQAKEDLKRGVSITDACIDLETTENIIHEAYEALAPRFG